jgi:hypothetical protein
LLIRLQQRRGTDNQWSSADPVLAAGEIALSTDESTFKIGDGVTAWSLLPYFQNSADIESIRIAVLSSANTYSDTQLNTRVTTAETTLLEAIGASLTASNDYTDTQIASLIDSAPETLNTLNELATALTANDGDIDSILATLATKASADHVHSIDDLTNVSLDSASLNDVIYFDSADSLWKSKPLTGIDAITVSTGVPAGAGELSYNSSSGEFTFNPAITGVTAGSFGVLNAAGPFAASTGGYHTYWDGSQNLEVSITTTSSYVNLISLTTDHFGTAAVKLVRVVDSIETDLFEWPLISTRDFSWTFYDEHNLDVGTVVIYRIKGQASSSTSYVGQNAEVQLHVQEVAGALGGQPTSPDITVAVADTGTTTGGLDYTDGVITYTPVLPAAAALSELTDVDLTDLGEGDVLAYDAGSSTWLPGSAASSIAQLTDVDLNGILNEAFLIFNDSTQLWEAQSVDIAPSIVQFNSQSSNYTLQLSDKDKMVEINSSSAAAITIPTNASVAFPVGSTITIMQAGAGQITISGATGVTVNYTPSNITRTQYSSATIVKRAENTWYLMGDLA